MTYASQTTVSAEKSRGEIERTLERYGAQSFVYGWDQSAATIMFQTRDRTIRFVLPLPSKDDPEFTSHSKGKRTPEAAMRLWEQSTRSRWRALALVIKAKLEAVESGITSFEDEFLAHTLLPSGETVGEWATPQLDVVFASGSMPALMPGTGGN